MHMRWMRFARERTIQQAEFDGYPMSRPRGESASSQVASGRKTSCDGAAVESMGDRRYQ